jgi:phosphopantetheine--protein transferase-like protein
MQEKLKEIVSLFIKVAPEEIGPATRIDRTAVQSSILLHRMYARLANEGIVPEDYSTIKVFGDLVPGASTPTITSATTAGPTTATVATATPTPTITVASTTADTVGIDMEDTTALPRATDFRKEEFYVMNFSPEEIAYCILQPDPYASFTGLFAVKEAIVKAGGRRRGEPFNTIHIRHSAEGKPLYPDFAISISHTQSLAVAVAIRSAGHTVPVLVNPPAAPVSAGGGSPGKVAWLALLLGIIALVVALIHRS